MNMEKTMNKLDEIAEFVNRWKLFETFIKERIKDLQSQAEYWDNIHLLSEKEIKKCMKDSDFDYENAIDRFRGYAYGRWIETKNMASLLELALADKTFEERKN